MEEEIWKDIPNYKGLYQASTKGRIRSLDQKQTLIGNGGTLYSRTKSGKILKPLKARNGYLFIYLRLNGNSNFHIVHRIIAETFLGKSELEVNHKDGNKINNAIDNLEYVTHSQNQIHSFRILNARHWQIKVKCEENGITYNSIKQASSSLGISKEGIARCCNGRIKSTFGYHFTKIGEHLV